MMRQPTRVPGPNVPAVGVSVSLDRDDDGRQLKDVGRRSRIRGVGDQLFRPI